MPELPEAETIARGLARSLPGRVILEISCRVPKLRARLLPSCLCLHCKGQRIRGVGRRGKGIIVSLEGGSGILIQLGMTGSCRIAPLSEALRKHDHVVFSLTGGFNWCFEDPRRFGMVEAYSLHEPELWPEFLRTLGPEPLGDSFSGSYLYSKSRRRTVTVKEMLLNQKIVAGIGNIYASEILFRSGVRPSRPAGSVTRSEAGKIVRATKVVLAEAIESGGTTISSYRDVDGSEGKFSRSLFVYGRMGEPCPECGRMVVRSVLGGRATYFCPGCQK